MALKACAECKREISDKAAQCPHCGFKPKKSSTLLPILGGLLLVAVVSMCNRSIETARDGKPTQDDPAATVRGLCMFHIKATLHDPDSAEFEHSSSATVGHSGNYWIVTRTVRSKNIFGALQKSEFECKYEQTGSDYRLISVKPLP